MSIQANLAELKQQHRALEQEIADLHDALLQSQALADRWISLRLSITLVLLAAALTLGFVLGVYREPVGGHWQIFCLLPTAKVEATPYQRDLSPTHHKRLLEVVKKLDRFVRKRAVNPAHAK